MINTYFFIPSDSQHKLLKSKTIAADRIIADLEDAVVSQNYELALNNLLDEESDYKIDIVRIEPDSWRDDVQHENLLKKYGTVMYPKVHDDNSYKVLSDFSAKYKVDIILLVEHPWTLLNLNKIVSDSLSFIKGLAFGNHDYSRVMNVDQYSEIVSSARMMISTVAKAYDIDLIDVASMELSDETKFKKECIQGFEMGYFSKMIIHPKQLEWISDLQLYSPEKIKWAQEVVRLMSHESLEKPIMKLNGQVIEKPHLHKAKAILKSMNL